MDLSRALGKASDAVTAAQDSHSNSTLSSDRANQSTAIAMEALVSLEEEYEQATTPEAKLAKAFDKLETLLQHTQGENPPDFDYAFNLDYGRKYTELNAQTRHLRAWIDEETRRLDTEPG